MAVMGAAELIRPHPAQAHIVLYIAVPDVTECGYGSFPGPIRSHSSSSFSSGSGRKDLGCLGLGFLTLFRLPREPCPAILTLKALISS